MVAAADCVLRGRSGGKTIALSEQRISFLSLRLPVARRVRAAAAAARAAVAAAAAAVTCPA